jgi:periplasmic protein TonB
MTQPPKKKRHWLPVTLVVVLVGCVGGGAVAFVRGFLNAEAPTPKKLVQEIRVIRPPPPPPDTPPPPPPPEEEVDVPDIKPDPVAENEAPPMEQLGLDVDGAAGGDAFGLLGRKGGRDLLGSGGSAFAWYAGLVKGEILDRLQDVKAARSGAYSVVIKVWVKSDGSVENIRLAQSTGSRERDAAIENELARITRISQGPPADMPQPMSLKLVSRA